MADPTAARPVMREGEPWTARLATASTRPAQWADWRFMADQMPDPCLWIEPDHGTILDCNAALTRVLGHRGVDLAGRPLECLAADADASQRSSAWQAMARGIELVDTDITVASLDGTAVPMSVSSSLLQAHDGGARCAFAVWRDVSRRRQSELGLVDTQQRLKTLAYELTLAESRERARIAQGLHDDIGQLLTLAHFKLDEWASTQAASAPEHAAMIDDLAALLRQATQATRSATFDLFCPLLRPLGLQTAIEGMAQRLARASSRMSVRLEGSVPALPLPEPVQAVVFRVVRELSLNAQKHAHATTLTISLRCAEGTLMIGVVDDGRGFQPCATGREFTPDGGFGLSSAEAQMRAIGGHLEIETGAGKGTRATLVLPLHDSIVPEATAS